MEVNFGNALCCDVVENEYEHKIYYSLILYNYDDKALYRISIPKDFSVDSITDFLSESVICKTKLSIYDGKNKFKLLSIQKA